MSARWYATAAVCAVFVVGTASALSEHRSHAPGHDGSGTTRPVERSSATTRVFYAETDHLSSARLDGRSFGPASTRLYSPQSTDPAWPSPDRHWLLLADGELVDLASDRPVAPVQAVPPELVIGPGENVAADAPVRLATSEPWADHSRRLVVAYRDRLSSVELFTGASVPLGTGRLPAGDPVSNGAAYVVPGPPPPRTVKALFPGSVAAIDRIDRVTAGKSAETLVTGAQVVVALGGQPGATVVASHLLFSADGSRLAVEVALFDGPRRAGAVVVLGRRGGVVDATETPFAHGRTWLAWSPTADRLAFGIPLPQARIEPAEEFLEPQLWRPGSQDVQPLVGVGAQASLPPNACLWAADGAALLCGDDTRWPIVTVVGRQQKVVNPVPGRPLAWVPAFAGDPRG